MRKSRIDWITVDDTEEIKTMRERQKKAKEYITKAFGLPEEAVTVNKPKQASKERK